MRELPQKVPPGILAPVMKMHGLDAAQSSAKSSAARKPASKPTKKVAENITEEYLEKRAQKQMLSPQDETKRWENTQDWLDRIIRKRLLTKDFRR